MKGKKTTEGTERIEVRVSEGSGERRNKGSRRGTHKQKNHTQKNGEVDNSISFSNLAAQSGVDFRINYLGFLHCSLADHITFKYMWVLKRRDKGMST